MKAGNKKWQACPNLLLFGLLGNDRTGPRDTLWSIGESGRGTSSRVAESQGEKPAEGLATTSTMPTPNAAVEFTKAHCKASNSQAIRC